ncbi:baculoviral IAP repeat-containing protein 5-like [Dreissena polymorpha]|uniref:baculoviral IAP repeat-containing protein 5-like n=1 Tax=Dreissena polymorpha TaxID=45954 RepID=UPI002263B405|nr:baculoviral IAP repeat-containing protein 5-like [Dreissena polymorpha]
MSKRGKRTSKKSDKTAEKENNVNLCNAISNYENPTTDEYKMLFAEHRLKSFTKDWPFDADSTCNPQSLADAGFYHIPSNEAPDACRCFCCFKELDGWEPEDIPMKEHKKHSSSCAFLSLTKPVSKLTVQEYLKLEAERQKNKLSKYYHMAMQEMQNHSALIETEMMKLLK